MQTQPCECHTMGLEVSVRATISKPHKPTVTKSADEMNKHYTVRKNKFNALLTSGRAQMTTFMKNYQKTTSGVRGFNKDSGCVCVRVLRV